MAEPRRPPRGKGPSAATTERLSQSVPDIEFDPNDATYRLSPSRQRRDNPTRGVRRNHSSDDNLQALQTTTSRKKTSSTATTTTSDKKRTGRKKTSSSSLHDSVADRDMSRSDSRMNASMSIASKEVSVRSSTDNPHKAAAALKRKKKPQQRPEDSSSLHASKEGLSTSRTSLNHSSQRDLSASRTSLNASKDLSRPRRRSTSRSKATTTATTSSSRRRSTSRSRTGERRHSSPSRQQHDADAGTNHAHSKASPQHGGQSRRDRSGSRDRHHHNQKTSASSATEKSLRRGDTYKPSRTTTTTTAAAAVTTSTADTPTPALQPPKRGTGNSNTMTLPIKTLGNKLYDVDRPRQNSSKQKRMARDEVSVQSNLHNSRSLLTNEQKAWKGIDDILDCDHESIATRDVLPEPVARAMHREKQQQQQRTTPMPMPELMNSSFSSFKSEMTSLTLNTAMTSANNNYVVQQSETETGDPMQAFLGSIAENFMAERTDVGEDHDVAINASGSELARTVPLNDTVTKSAGDDKNDTLRSRSTESSGSIGIQEYYASSSSQMRHLSKHGNDDDEHDSSDDEDHRYDPTIQAYGRASMPPKKPHQSKSVDGISLAEMPALMDSSFSSLQSEMTDIQSIISTAKNFVVKDNQPMDEDDPMSAFLGRITNGLKARQMLVEEEGVEEDDLSGERKSGVLEDVNDIEGEDEYADDDADSQPDNANIGHIPAEDELSGAGQSVPDEDDLSGEDLDADEDFDDDEESAESTADEEDEQLEEDDFDEPENDVPTYLPPNTPGGLNSIPSLSSVSTINTHQQSLTDQPMDALAKWAANLRHELAQKMADENRPLTAEEEELAEMEKALARAAEIAAAEKNETDITRVVLDEEIVQGIIAETQKRTKAAAGVARKKMKKKASVDGTGATVGGKGVRPAKRPPAGRRKVIKKKKKLPVQPLPAPAEDPEKFSALFKEEERPEQIARQKASMPVAAVKAVAKAAIPIPKHSKKDKYEQKSTLKSLKEKLQRLSFRRGKSGRRNSPTSVGGDEGKFFPRENREEDEDEDASFL